MLRIFYRRHEVVGLSQLPATGPAILCANHANALVDAVVIQATCPRPIHPLARSGLFRRFGLRTLLDAIQAVPIYRRSSGQGVDVRRSNEESFARCFEYLAAGRVLLIFPEGQSHSDPTLRPLKTGAARLALGQLERTGILPKVFPVGLTFAHKGRFRTSLLVQYGKPVQLEPTPGLAPEEQFRQATAAIERGLLGVTLSVDSWDDLELLRHLQSFFALRRQRQQGERRFTFRFRVLKRLIAVQRSLRQRFPAELQALTQKLQHFKQLCERYGVQDYHLNLRYRPKQIIRFLWRAGLFAVLVFPLALWGLLNSALPYFLTRQAVRLIARGRDQYDSAGMGVGLFLFLLFWSGQTFIVHSRWGLWPALAYAASLPLTGAVALAVHRERLWLSENLRVFFLFLRRRKLRSYLQTKRAELEFELARLGRLARHFDPGAEER